MRKRDQNSHCATARRSDTHKVRGLREQTRFSRGAACTINNERRKLATNMLSVVLKAHFLLPRCAGYSAPATKNEPEAPEVLHLPGKMGNVPNQNRRPGSPILRTKHGVRKHFMSTDDRRLPTFKPLENARPANEKVSDVLCLPQKQWSRHQRDPQGRTCHKNMERAPKIRARHCSKTKPLFSALRRPFPASLRNRNAHDMGITTIVLLNGKGRQICRRPQRPPRLNRLL